MSTDSWWVWVVLFFILVAFLIWLFGRKKETPPARMAHPVEAVDPEVEKAAPVIPIAPAAAVVGIVPEIEAAPAVEPVQEATAVPAVPDDLAIIEGIGPKISALLQRSGIATFRQLAQTEVSRLDEILTQANLRRLADPGSWPEQAALAADGRWDDLKSYQQTLKGGRKA